MKNEKKYYRNVMVYGTMAFFCCLITFLILLRQENDSYMLFVILMGCIAGSIIGAIVQSKRKYRTSPKAFLAVLLIAVCAIGLSLLMFFTMANPVRMPFNSGLAKMLR